MLPPVADPEVTRAPPLAPAAGEAAARRELRRQVAGLERRLSDAVLAAFPHALAPAAPAARGARRPRPAPHLLSLAELEALRDDLARRMTEAQRQIEEITRRQERARERLERMLRDPRRHRFERVACAELGEPGCGVWQVRPRLGLVGMLAGWWEVKLSSGCPRPG